MRRNSNYDKEIIKCDPIRRIKVISKNEWERLNSQLNRENAEQAQLEERRRSMEQLKKQSEEMVKNWTNTFLGARQKKLEEREKRLANEEAARVEIDEEEARIQAAKRKEAIEEAKLKIYHETDRVKKFHSALILTEVLKERDTQVEFKRLCKLMNADKDQVYVNNLRRQLEEAKIKEEIRMAEQREKNIKTANEFKEQMRMREEARAQEQVEKQLEREQMLRMAKEDQEEREANRLKDLNESKRLMEDYMHQMKGNQQAQLIERLKEEEEEDKCRVFAAAKKKMTMMRVLKEKEIFLEREREMERIRELLAEQIKRKIDDESDRIARAQAEKDEEVRLQEAAKAKATAEKLVEMEAYRLETIQRHRREQEEARQLELEEVRKRNESNRAFAECETKCFTQKLEQARALSKDYLEQARQKEENKKRDRANEIRLASEGNKLLQEEDRIFRDYTKRVIEHCEAGGRNTYPMIVASRSHNLIAPEQDPEKAKTA